jgi:hypothetical protein
MFAVEEIPPGIVRLEFAGGMSAADEAAYLDTLDRLSTRAMPFVVVALMDGRNPLSPDGRKRQALWFKRNREQLGAYCRGLVRVPSGSAHDAGGDKLAAALPFPLAHAGSEAAAMRIARRLLAGGR